MANTGSWGSLSFGALRTLPLLFVASAESLMSAGCFQKQGRGVSGPLNMGIWGSTNLGFSVGAKRHATVFGSVLRDPRVENNYCLVPCFVVSLL